MELLIGLVVVFVIIFIIRAEYLADEARRQKIIAYLKNKNFTFIQIENVWFDRDRDTSTYNVSYMDEQGRRHHTSCKIRNRLWKDNIEIYWKHQP